MADTKFYTTYNEDSVNSTQRITNVTVPPFSYSGSVQLGVSGFYSPPQKIRLTKGYLTSSTIGSGVCTFAVIKRTEYQDDELLALITMPPEKTKVIFDIDNSMASKVIAPYEKIFVASFVASGHENVVLQMYAEKVS
jgi:hypothetical protein